MKDIKILNYIRPSSLEEAVRHWVNEEGYSLVGPVTIGYNNNGNTIYVATLMKEVT